MKDYCIWVVSPPGYVHSHTFNELALGLNCAFHTLGINAPIVYNFEKITAYPIILGCNLIPSMGFVKLPKTSILYNLEQILIGSPWITENYLNLLRSYEVWDYSKQNICELLKLGIANVKYCGIGYVPELTRIKPAPSDVDFLWYGSLNERRAHILQQLHNMGFKVKILFGVYGEQRDSFIAKSKIVLNIHFYESKVLEIVRIYYLLANKRFVISERGKDQELEEPIRDGLVITDYNNLVEECAKYLREDALRNEIAEKGFSRITSFSQVQFLRDVLNY
jgi:hypothetical protein